MAVAYPTNLVIPLVGNYSQADSNKVRRNDVETGPPRFELLSEHGPGFFTATWLFSPVDFQVFEGWFNFELTFGSESFDMDIQVGAGLKEHEFYFDKPYASKLVGKLWRVSARLIAVEKQYDTEADFDQLLLLRAAVEGNLDIWIDQFTEIVEQTLPDNLP